MAVITTGLAGALLCSCVDYDDNETAGAHGASGSQRPDSSQGQAASLPARARGAETTGTHNALTIADVLHLEDEFELCDAVHARLATAVSRAGLAEPTHDVARFVVFLWDAYGLIENGGFEYLLGSKFPARDPNLVRTIEGLEAIGATDLASTFKEVRGVFPNSEIPRDGAERVRIYKSEPESRRSRLAETVWDRRSKFMSLMATYIRNHQSAIERALADCQRGE